MASYFASGDGNSPFRVRPSLPSDGTFGNPGVSDADGKMRAMLATLADPTLAPQHKALISDMILVSIKADAHAAAQAAAQAAQAQSHRFESPHTAYSVKSPTMVTSKT